MAETFDPVRKRKHWLDFSLKYETEFVPDQIPPQGQPLYVSVLTNCLITGYLLGLADRVRPTLQAVVAWMDSQPGPKPGLFSGPRDFWHDDWYALYAWHRTLGLAKWLCGMAGAEKHFGTALAAEMTCWRTATPEQIEADGDLRRARLLEHLALALAARLPRAGTDFDEAAGRPDPQELPRIQVFATWACRHLTARRPRDEEFRERARLAMASAIWPDYLSVGRYTEPALWMKFLFHDSGEVSTPEQALLRLYDFLPGGKRPSFVDDSGRSR